VTQETSAPTYSLPATSSGAAYAGLPQHVNKWLSIPPCDKHATQLSQNISLLHQTCMLNGWSKG